MICAVHVCTCGAVPIDIHFVYDLRCPCIPAVLVDTYIDLRLFVYVAVVGAVVAVVVRDFAAALLELRVYIHCASYRQTCWLLDTSLLHCFSFVQMYIVHP